MHFWNKSATSYCIIAKKVVHLHAIFMTTRCQYIEPHDKWRLVRYSSIFSRHIADNILSNDFEFLKDLIRDYDVRQIGNRIITYKDYLSYIFRYLTCNYRNEYIVKNALLNKIIKDYGTSHTIALNEFSVGNSIADVVLFNGNSRAYEIKTEYDSAKRLNTQLTDYTEIFQFCYLVVHEKHYEKYRKEINSNVGIVAYSLNKGRICFEEKKPAIENIHINPHLLIRCLRTEEYKKIVKSYYGVLPTEMNAFNAFNICEELITNIPEAELHQLFIAAIKGRKNNMKYLSKYEPYLRQLCLSMHIMPKDYDILNSRLLTTINI